MRRPHVEIDGNDGHEALQDFESQLAREDVSALVLPAIPYGVTRLAQSFAGGVTLRPGTLWALVEDMVLSLQQDGIRQLLLCNCHHEWEHQRVLHNLALDYVERGEGACQILMPARNDSRLEEVECHGGRRETSLMLAAAPGRVEMQDLERLEPFQIDLPVPERGVNRSLAELGAARGYCGDPSGASQAEGSQLLQQLAEGHVSACRETWADLFVLS